VFLEIKRSRHDGKYTTRCFLVVGDVLVGFALGQIDTFVVDVDYMHDHGRMFDETVHFQAVRSVDVDTE
jgi:hypothetical protein